MKKQLITLCKADYNKVIAKMKKDIRLIELFKTKKQRPLTPEEVFIMKTICELDYGVIIA